LYINDPIHLPGWLLAGMPIVCWQAEEANFDRTKVVVIKVRVVVDQSSSIVTGRLIELSG